MNEFLEILKYILPTIIVGGIFLLLMNQLSKKEKTIVKSMDNLDKEIKILSLKLQAYERIILFLERNKPNALLVRLNQPDQTHENLHREILKTVRDEYDHNITQQIYISEEGWNKVKYAKESLIKIINTAASNTAGTDQTNLTSSIIELYTQQDIDLIEDAIKQIKKETKQTLS